MSDFAAEWLILVGVFAVALASPGPDFIMAVRNAILYSRRAGIMTAIGFGLGVAVHVAYCLGGLAIVISKSVLLFSILKYLGAAYLFYIGVQALRSRGAEVAMIAGERSDLGDLAALRSGFITNLFNPKATLFFLALFTQIIDPGASPVVQAAYGATCVAMTMLWFSLVATVLSTPSVRARFLRMSKAIDRMCGALFIALGVKLAATRL